ncbi:MAG: HYExAFE family protein [Planctomyces sp.]|nr:HYExAFE family protein [Planctomyces sp.]
MALRSNHYELAFEAWLRSQRRPYVAVNERRRPLAAGRSLKSMDFIVYASFGPHLLVDIKGRRFPRPGESGHAWESWATMDDVDCLLEWERCFGADFRAAFVFAYDVPPRPDDGEGECWEFRGRQYTFYAVLVSEYLEVMRRRSPKWETVSLPAAEFRRLRRPAAQLLS